MGDSSNAVLAARLAHGAQCSCAYCHPTDWQQLTADRDYYRQEANRLADELRAIKRELSMARTERDIAMRRAERLMAEVVA